MSNTTKSTYFYTAFNHDIWSSSNFKYWYEGCANFSAIVCLILWHFLLLYINSLLQIFTYPFNRLLLQNNITKLTSSNRSNRSTYVTVVVKVIIEINSSSVNLIQFCWFYHRNIMVNLYIIYKCFRKTSLQNILQKLHNWMVLLIAVALIHVSIATCIMAVVPCCYVITLIRYCCWVWIDVILYLLYLCTYVCYMCWVASV